MFTGFFFVSSRVLLPSPEIFVKNIPPQAPCVTVNGEVQPFARAELLLREQLSRGVPHTAELESAVRENLVAQVLMAQEAVKAGLDQRPLVQAQIDLARIQVLAQAWQQTVQQELPMSDTDLRAEYGRQVAQLGQAEVQLRHVLLAQETQACDVLERLLAGESLADLAVACSIDEQARQTRGLIDWMPQGQLLPPLAQAVQGLEPGQHCPQAVQTPLGWHVVLLEGRRAYTPPPFEQVKPQLVQAVQQQRLQERIQSLRRHATVV